MLKLAAFAAAAIAVVCVTVAALVIAAELALGQDAVIVAEPSFLDSLSGALAQPLGIVLGMILVTLGGQAIYWINKLLGPKAAKASTDLYKEGVIAAAGFLNEKLPAGVRFSEAQLDDAIGYFRRSWEKASALEPSDVNVGNDIIAELGRLKANG